MQDPPSGIFVAKEHGATGEALRIPELERDEDDSGTQWLDAQVGRNQPVVRRPATRVGADVGEHGTERGVDAAGPDDPFGHLGRRLEDGGRVGERSTERRPVEILERGQEAFECVGHGGRVSSATGRGGAARRRARLALEARCQRQSSDECREKCRSEQSADRLHGD